MSHSLCASYAVIKHTPSATSTEQNSYMNTGKQRPRVQVHVIAHNLQNILQSFNSQMTLIIQLLLLVPSSYTEGRRVESITSYNNPLQFSWDLSTVNNNPTSSTVADHVVLWHHLFHLSVLSWFTYFIFYTRSHMSISNCLGSPNLKQAKTACDDTKRE